MGLFKLIDLFSKITELFLLIVFYLKWFGPSLSLFIFSYTDTPEFDLSLSKSYPLQLICQTPPKGY